MSEKNQYAIIILTIYNQFRQRDMTPCLTFDNAHDITYANVYVNLRFHLESGMNCKWRALSYYVHGHIIYIQSGIDLISTRLHLL